MNDSSTPSWREELGTWLTQTASSVDDFVDIRWRRLKSKMGFEATPQIQPYIGYANSQQVWLHGRVLTNPLPGLPGEDDTWWDNIGNTYQRFASDEVPDCNVSIKFEGRTYTVTSDAEGYFFFEGERAANPRDDQLWETATMRVVDSIPGTQPPIPRQARILTPVSSARTGIISDVDDTILHTGATQLLTMARHTFLGNARVRQPLEGVASLYTALHQHRGERNPCFYVSSSPWNLFDLLEDFLDLHGLPPGPLLLRDLGFDENKFLKDGHDHKLQKIRRVPKAFPTLPFLLIGDSGQEDARIYVEAAEEHGERIRAILIRDVDPRQNTDRDKRAGQYIKNAAAHGVPMHLIADSTEAANILQQMDLLTPAAVQDVASATAKDQSRD